MSTDSAKDLYIKTICSNQEMDKDFQHYKNNIMFSNSSTLHLSSINLYSEVEDTLMTFDEVCSIVEDKKIEIKEGT